MERNTTEMEEITNMIWEELPEVPLACLAPRVPFASYWEWAQPYSSGVWEVPHLHLLLLLDGGVNYRAWDTRGRLLRGEARTGELLVFFAGREQYQVLPAVVTRLYQIAIIPAGGVLACGVPALPGVGRLPHRTAVGGELPRLAAVCLRLVRALLTLPVGWQLEMAAGALELLHSAFRAGSPPPPRPSLGPWETLLARMDAAETLPSVRELAEDMGYSVNHFTRLFRQRTGTTPKQYLLTRRLAQARGLLAEGLPVQQAARRCGFDDPLYFSRLFKQLFGVPPSQVPELPGPPSMPDAVLPLNCHLAAPGEAINARYLGPGQDFS